MGRIPRSRSSRARWAAVLGSLFVLVLGVTVPDRTVQVVVAPPAGERAHAQAQTTRAVASAATAFGLTTDLHVLVYEMGGGDLAHTEVRVGPVEGVTDEHGYVELESVPWGIHDIVLGGDFIAEPSFATVFGDEQDTLIISAFSYCPGGIQVVEADGAPAAGVPVLVPGFEWSLVADAGGWLDFDPEERRCGTAWYTVNAPEGSGPSIRATVEDTEPLILRLPAAHTAELWVVDRDDRFVDADVRSGVLDFEAVWRSTGHYEIRAPGNEVGVRVTYEGLGSSATVPLDRNVHLVHVGDVADVLVHARCDADCPPVHSSMGDCDEQSPGEFLCPCNPQRDSIIADQPERRYVRVAAGQTDVTLDLRSGRAIVRGIWAGLVPVSISAGGTGDGGSGAAFEFPVMPGARDITFIDRENQTAHRSVDLDPDQVLDLGLVQPDARRSVRGSIVADFPLPGVVTEIGGSFASATLTPESHGDFSLEVSTSQSSVYLSFSTDDYGPFRATFPTDAAIEWNISWHLDRRGLSDDDIAEVILANEDTAAPIADTGFDPDSGF